MAKKKIEEKPDEPSQRGLTLYVRPITGRSVKDARDARAGKLGEEARKRLLRDEYLLKKQAQKAIDSYRFICQKIANTVILALQSSAASRATTEDDEKRKKLRKAGRFPKQDAIDNCVLTAEEKKEIGVLLTKGKRKGEPKTEEDVKKEKLKRDGANPTADEIEKCQLTEAEKDAIGDILLSANRPNTVETLERIFGKLTSGGRYTYPMRNWAKAEVKRLGMDWLSVMVDGPLEDVDKYLKNPSQSFHGLPRDIMYVLKEGAIPPLFRNMGFRFRAAELRDKQVFKKNGIDLEWDKGVGSIHFVIVGEKKKDGSRQVDKGRRITWNKIRNGEYSVGDVRLSYELKDDGSGKLRTYFKINISYSMPKAPIVMDKGRDLEVSFRPQIRPGVAVGKDLFHVELISDSKGKRHLDFIKKHDLSAAAAVKDMKKNERNKKRLAAALSSCGNKRARNSGQGHKKAHKSTSRQSQSNAKKKQNVSKGWNQKWTTSIIHLCRRYRAGTLYIRDLPDDLLGLSWPWEQFKHDLRYKCKHAGIDLHIESQVVPPKKKSQKDAEKEACLEDLPDEVDEVDEVEDVDPLKEAGD